MMRKHSECIDTNMEQEKICICGDTENQHVNNCEQCFIPECGCKEFEEQETQKEKCARGEHNFIECDEWSKTCTCGAVEK